MPRPGKEYLVELVEQKTKFIIIGLAAVLTISLFINLQTSVTKNKIQRERDDLEEENASLNKRIEVYLKDNRGYQEKIRRINSDLDNISQEKEDIQQKYDLIVKERDELVKKLGAKVQGAVPTKVEPEISDTYWAGILKTKTDLGLKLDDIRSELNTLRINNEELKRERGTLELELENLNKEKESLEQQIEYEQKMLDKIASERVLETNAKRHLQNRLSSLKNENKILKNQVKILGQHKTNLESRLARVQEDKITLERRFTEMALLLEDKLSQVGDLRARLDSIRSDSQVKMPEPKKESVELPPIVVRPQAGGVLSSPDEISAFTSSGKILAVNKENNFVIIDLGKTSGIKVGDAFQVYREGKSIAAIEVIQTRNNIAACDIKTETTPIQVGDIIR